MALSAGPAEGAVVVMDQIGDPSTYASGLSKTPSGSQIFPDFPTFDAMAIDDFTVDGPELLVTAVGGLFLSQAGFDAFDLVSAYQVSVFSSPALAGTSLRGDIADLLVAPGSGAGVVRIGEGGLGLVSIATNFYLPAAGTYWMGISPVASFSAVGAFFIQNEGAQGAPGPGNGNGGFANPGLGHGQGALGDTTLDFAYRASVVPEPSIACLMLAGLTLLGMRRRTQGDPACS